MFWFTLVFSILLTVAAGAVLVFLFMPQAKGQAQADAAMGNAIAWLFGIPLAIGLGLLAAWGWWSLFHAWGHV